ncbi:MULTISPECIES: Fic family protein [unclassified Streptomyces]|uniref:Fic family protein n=1 Tax=unclassified Streptomyces TaxID=2593676 RepID=UPI002E8204B6|nr:Fic family protein [Streptomyces sp. NBC_00589]WTI39351.1 Fic family protein [Streptomyces sp. NBC_00775]WUB26970.1 Fic family protein [Streptomyces sp. NBC_00589]
MTTEAADSLAVWCEVREQVDWAASFAVRGETPSPVRAAVDGLATWFDETVRARDAARADRLLAAVARSRVDAARKRPLTIDLMASWQRLALGVPDVRFRQGDAFAKGGRERYALTPHTRQDFAACLRQSTDPEVPVAARAARAYLDVAFFHPFPDGNARLALLTLAYVLDLEGVRLDQVGPLQTTRYADDPAGAADLAVLVSVLIRATHRRGARARAHS